MRVSGSTNSSDSPHAGEFTMFDNKSDDFTAVSGTHYVIDTSAGAVESTLPDPDLGVTIGLFRIGDNAVNITAPMFGGFTDFSITATSRGATLVGTGTEWRIVNTVGTLTAMMGAFWLIS